MGSARDSAAYSLAALANDTAELGRLELRAARYVNRLCAHGDTGKVFLRRTNYLAALVGDRRHHDRNDPGRDDAAENYRIAYSGAASLKWLMVSLIVGFTVLADLLHSFDMKLRAEVYQVVLRVLWSGRRSSLLASSGPLVVTY